MQSTATTAARWRPGVRMEATEWKNAHPGVKTQWCECSAGVICPCGAELVVDEEEDTTCGCGRVYRMTSALRVKEPSGKE